MQCVRFAFFVYLWAFKETAPMQAISSERKLQSLQSTRPLPTFLRDSTDFAIGGGNSYLSGHVRI